MKKTRYANWTLIDWDGNYALGHKVWRKSFGRGHVSIGVGEFVSVVYSYGPNSDISLASTRWRNFPDDLISEVDMMTIVDNCKGDSGGVSELKKLWANRPQT